VGTDMPTRDEVNRQAASRGAFWWLVVVVLVVVGSLWELLLFGLLHHPPAVLAFLPFVAALVPLGGIIQSIRTQVRESNATPNPQGWAPWWVWVNRHPFLVVGIAAVVVMAVIGLFVFRS
jgi:hypothetical protein